VSEPGLAVGSGRLAGAISRLERERLWSGAVAQALRRWSQVAHRPRRALSGGCGCPLCNPFYTTDERAVLELALHALPSRAARELREFVAPLDELYLARSWPDPTVSPDEGWWARRCSG
jgi:hypothetical protein